MPAGVRERITRMGRAMAGHKVTTAVFAISLAAILAFGIFAGVSGSGSGAGSASAASSGAAGSGPGAVGQQAPKFSLATLENAPGGDSHVSLAAYAGRPVIVNFFASWCEPCQQETPMLAKFYRSAHGTINLIGVDANDSQAHGLAFAKRYGVSYPVGSDPAVTTAGAYGVVALPQTFFLNAQHKIVDRVFGKVTPASLAKGVKLMGGTS